MILIIPLIIVALLVVWIIGSYNSLVGMRNQVLNGWRQIDVQLKRRHDLIPNLVNSVRGSMDFERDTLTAVMEARAKALTATGPADAAQKEGQLTQALGRLIAVAENYPTLKANDSGYVGNYSTAIIAAAPLPIPLAFDGTFQAYRLSPAPARAKGFLARLADLFAGCGRH